MHVYVCRAFACRYLHACSMCYYVCIVDRWFRAVLNITETFLRVFTVTVSLSHGQFMQMLKVNEDMSSTSALRITLLHSQLHLHATRTTPQDTPIRGGAIAGSNIRSPYARRTNSRFAKLWVCHPSHTLIS